MKISNGIVSVTLLLLFANGYSLDNKEHKMTASPVARSNHTLATINNVVYLFGGEGNSQTAKQKHLNKSRKTSSLSMSGDILGDMWKFAGEWEELTPGTLPSSRHSHEAAAIGDNMYVFGGRDISGENKGDLWVYSVINNTWTRLHRFTSMGSRYNHSLTVAQGKLWVSGGNNGGGALAALYCYDPSTDIWEQKATMPHALEGHSSVTYNDNIYVYGGTQEILKYDTSLDSWEKLPATALPARYYHIAIADGELMHVFGGIDLQGQELDDCWEYHFPTDTWISRTSMPFTLSHSAAAMLGSSQSKMLKAGSIRGVLFFGGLSDGTRSDRTLFYNPDEEGHWEELTNIDTHPAVAQKFSLSQNYPNPFNPVTTIKYSLLKPDYVTLKVYDLAGHEVETLIHGFQTAGEYQKKWYVQELANGVYLYRIQAGAFSKTMKMILQK